MYGITQWVPATNLIPNRSYKVSVWVKSASFVRDAGASAVSVALERNAGPGTATEDREELPASNFQEAWAMVSTVLEYVPGPDGDQIQVEVLNRGTDNGCFLVDDTSLVVEPAN